MKIITLAIGLQLMLSTSVFSSTKDFSCEKEYNEKIAEAHLIVSEFDPSYSQHAPNWLVAGFGVFLVGLGIEGFQAQDSGAWSGGHDGRIVSSTVMTTLGVILTGSGLTSNDSSERLRKYNKAKNDLKSLPLVQSVAQYLQIIKGPYNEELGKEYFNLMLMEVRSKVRSSVDFVTAKNLKFMFNKVYTEGYACQLIDLKDLYSITWQIIDTLNKYPHFVQDYMDAAKVPSGQEADDPFYEK